MMAKLHPTEVRTIDAAKNLLDSYGFVVLRENSYRQAQERQRVAHARAAWETEMRESVDRWAREELCPEIRALRERVTFLYGAALAAGCTDSDLRGHDGAVVEELDAIDAADEAAAVQ